MKILERFINFKDNNESPVLQNDKISALLEKLKNNTEFKMEDLTFLESLSLNFSNNEIEQKIKDEKEKQVLENVQFTNQIKLEEEKHQNSQIINLGEESAANNEEEISDRDENNDQKLYLTKSKVAESNMREIDKYTTESIKRSLVQQNIRNSITSNYLKSKGTEVTSKCPVPINVFSKAKTSERQDEQDNINLNTHPSGNINVNNNQSSTVNNQNESTNISNNVNAPTSEEKTVSNIKKQKQKQQENQNLTDLLGIINNANKYVDEVNNKYISTSNELNKKDLKPNLYVEDQVIKQPLPSTRNSNKPVQNNKVPEQSSNSQKYNNYTQDRQEKSPLRVEGKSEEANDAKANFYKMMEYTEKKKNPNLFQIPEDDIPEDEFESSSNLHKNEHHLEVSDTVAGFKKKEEISPKNFVYSNNNFPTLNQTETMNNFPSIGSFNNRETLPEYNKTNVYMSTGIAKSLEELNKNLEKLMAEYRILLVNSKLERKNSNTISNDLKSSLG